MTTRRYSVRPSCASPHALRSNWPWVITRPGGPAWREHLFGWMMTSSESAMEFFRLPTNRIVELGNQVEI